MIHSLARLKQAMYGFNRKVFTADDFHRLTKREGISVAFWKLDKNVNGFYGLNRLSSPPDKYIIINETLLPDRWLFTGFHELIHHFLSVPDVDIYYSKGVGSHEERQADMYARMMVIPKPLLLELLYANAEELEGFDEQTLRSRWADFDRLGE